METEIVLTEDVPFEGLVTFHIPALRPGDIQAGAHSFTVGGVEQTAVTYSEDYFRETVYVCNRGTDVWAAGAKCTLSWTGDLIEVHVTDQAARLTALEAPQLGVVDGSDAKAGEVGEFVSATVLVQDAVPAPNNSNINVTSLALTAGDWEVQGQVWVTNMGVTSDGPPVNIVGVAVWTHMLSVTQPPEPQGSLQSLIGINYPVAGGNLLVVNSGRARFSYAAPTIVYLSGNVQYTGTGSLGLYGHVSARRVR